MKIELEIPYIEDELSIKITIKRDGQVLVDDKKSTNTTPPVKAQSGVKRKSAVKDPSSLGGNFMNADF